MFSFFQKNKVKINSTKTGSHGKHWYGIFDHATEESTLKSYFLLTLEKGIKYQPNNKMIVVEDSLIRAIVYKDTIITGFPYLIGSKNYSLEIKTIIEWTHSDRLEAIIQAGYLNQYGLSFFAIDYAFHKNTYKTNSNLDVALVGFGYYLEEFIVGKEFEVDTKNGDIKRITFDENFCGYLPTEETDEIQITGKIQDIKQYNLSHIDGFIVTIGIAPDLNLDVFIAQTNLRTSLEINKHVCGLVWLQGTLENYDSQKI